MSVALALVVVTSVCFAIPSLRWLALIGVFLFVSVFPLASSLLILLAGGVYLYVRRHLKRSKHHVRTKLFD